ncbi:TPA: adenine methyltransferase [Enterobacter hormaechei subsp. steigerwaltii]|nr:adenine methyltransferase [Enterobacter hormaechei subsp. steigerwaltii]
MPNQKYSLIMADPPWSYGNTISNGAAADHYPTMKLIDIKRLPVWELAAENSVLAMWYTGTHNQEAIELAEAWGFTVRTMKGFTWVKLNQNAELRINKALAEGEVADFYDFLDLLNSETRMNGVNHTRANTEDLLIATRGTGLERKHAGIKQVVYSPLGAHSEKPWEVRHRLELLYGDVPRIELFSRSAAPGWHHWGNECSSSITLTPGMVGPSEPTPEGYETDCVIWPSEVEMVFSAVEHDSAISEKNKRKLKFHINRMWLEKTPIPQIVVSARSLIATMERIS